MAAVLLAVMAGFGAVSFTQISQAKSQSLTLDRVSDIQATSLELHADVAALSAAQREWLTAAAPAGDSPAAGQGGAQGDRSPTRARFEQLADQTRAHEQALRTIVTRQDPQAWQDLAATARTGIDAFLAADAQARTLTAAGDPSSYAKARQLTGTDGQKALDAADAAVDALVQQLSQTQARVASTAQSSARSSQTLIAAATALAFLLTGAGVLLIALSITGPLQGLRSRMEAIAQGDGDLTVRLPVEGRDELTDVSATFNEFAEKIAGTLREVTEASLTLVAAAEQLAANTSTIAGAAEDASDRSRSAAEASRGVNTSVQVLAGAAGELGESIREISHNTAKAADVAAVAVAMARDTTATVARLGQSSAEISAVVDMITGVAEQTNLLALNATIEAARAGEAGRGFAVVAGEVKELAQQTAQATEDISHRISEIQSVTAAAVTAIEQIGEVVDQVNDFQASIAGAVEEQTATAGEMTHSVAEAADGSQQITDSIDAVAHATDTTRISVEEARRASADLARMGSHLQTLVTSYRT